jgi:glycosyltransferase involved in cell wall biosynthesis
MSRRLLLIAYHFPPIQGSTGVTRTLAAAKYLQEFGWEVTVLTVSADAYESVNDSNFDLIPTGTRVERAWAVDARKRLSFRGRYPLLLAIPDRWQSWIVGGLIRGLNVVREWRPDVLLATYPIASAQCIGILLHRMTGVPLVAELRDPMAQVGYPAERPVHRSFERIERSIFRHASRVVVTTPGCARTYATRFSDYPADSIVVVPNGFDPELFPAAPETQVLGVGTPLRVLHSGVLYPKERNPNALFAAIAELRREKVLQPHNVQFVFRASGLYEEYQALLVRLEITDLVQMLPSISYRDALREMTTADALLILQASNCNEQIPAKLYEYFHCRRPILGLTDLDGDTAKCMLQQGMNSIASLDDKEAIKSELPAFLERVRSGREFVLSADAAARFSRRETVRELGNLLDTVAQHAPPL